MKLIAAVAVSVTLLMGQSDPSAARSVTAVRYWSLKDVTRVAVGVSGPFQYHTDRLHNPDRVYFDILNAHLRIDSKRFYVDSVGDALLTKIRVAETTPGITRVVLDLTGNAAATTSTLTNPDRLIIELRMPAGNPLRTEAPPTATPVHWTGVDRLPSPVTLKPVVVPLPPPPELKVTVVPETSKPSSAAVPPAARPAPVDSAPAAARPAPAASSAVTRPTPVESTSAGRPSSAAVNPPTTKLAPADSAPAAAAPAPAPDPAHVAAGDPGPDEIAKAARPTSAGTNSLIRTLGLKINRVVIDPGHGGHDQGTEGSRGLIEKEVVLDVALRVGKLVQDHMGAEVIYTRSDDTFVPLEGRTALANEKKADLFLSIHANSSSYPNISGVETYYLNINGSKDAMDVARRENGPTLNSIFDLQDIVKKIALHDKSEESHEFAKRMEASLYSFSLKNFPGTKDRGVKTAPFIVLIGANMPSVLAEIGFLTNSREEALLKRSDYRQKLAEALYKGMEKYTDSLSHFQAAAKP
jgi:N-acetylmuramoyl-L-alanine amidase